jgi:hypothetical protein
MKMNFELRCAVLSHCYRILFTIGINKYDADTLMMSVLSTLKTQLLPKVTVTNCCSGFHQLINDLLLEGCGWVEANTNKCLQDTDDQLLVPCCGYHVQCMERKKEILEVHQRSKNSDGNS